MKAYIYKADIYCETCGEAIQIAIPPPPEPGNESSYDSDDWPKGPYPNGGGEADTPQHCAECHAFLENPLTHDGVQYVIDSIPKGPDDVLGPVTEQWAEYYADSYHEIAEAWEQFLAESAIDAG